MPKEPEPETIETGDPLEQNPEEIEEEPQAPNDLEQEEEVEPEVQPVPVAAAPQRNYQSPYAQQQPTSEDEELEQLLGTRGMELFEKRLDQRLQQFAVSQAQQQHAVTQLGMPESLLNEYGPDIQRYMAGVPKELRGKREAAIIALQSAITERMISGDNPAQVYAELSRHYGSNQPVQQVQQKAQPLPPESRMTSPRGGTARAIPQHVKPNQSYRDMWKSRGLSESEISELMEGAK